MNTFYKNWQQHQIKKASQSREKNRSFGQQLFPVYISVTIGTILIHLISFFAAIIYPAHVLDTMTGNAIAGVILGSLFIFAFIEIPKYVCINTAFENYFDSSLKSYGLISVAACCVSCSIFSSTYGVELGVKWLSPNAELLSIEQIEEKYDALIEKEKSYWQPKIDNKNLEKEKYFKDNAKFYAKEGRTRLSSSKTTKEPYNKLLASLTNSENSLRTRILDLEGEKKEAINLAKSKNLRIEQNHDNQKDHASIVSFWVMLLLELVYIGGIAYKAYYQYRSEKELLPVQDQTTKIVDINQTKPIKQQQEQEQQVEKQQVVAEQNKTNTIGFKTHGSVFTPEGGTVSKVWYQTTKGGWSCYSKSDLNRLIKRKTGSEDWKNELKGLVQKLEDFENKNK